MTGVQKTKLFYAAAGLFLGWLFGGTLNAGWFLYSVSKLGYGKDDPAWYTTAVGFLRPGVILISMAAGYFLSQCFFRRTTQRTDPLKQ